MHVRSWTISIGLHCAAITFAFLLSAPLIPAQLSVEPIQLFVGPVEATDLPVAPIGEFGGGGAVSQELQEPLAGAKIVDGGASSGIVTATRTGTSSPAKSETPAQPEPLQVRSVDETRPIGVPVQADQSDRPGFSSQSGRISPGIRVVSIAELETTPTARPKKKSAVTQNPNPPLSAAPFPSEPAEGEGAADSAAVVGSGNLSEPAVPLSGRVVELAQVEHRRVIPLQSLEPASTGTEDAGLPRVEHRRIIPLQSLEPISTEVDFPTLEPIVPDPFTLDEEAGAATNPRSSTTVLPARIAISAPAVRLKSPQETIRAVSESRPSPPLSSNTDATIPTPDAKPTIVRRNINLGDPVGLSSDSTRTYGPGDVSEDRPIARSRSASQGTRAGSSRTELSLQEIRTLRRSIREKISTCYNRNWSSESDNETNVVFRVEFAPNGNLLKHPEILVPGSGRLGVEVEESGIRAILTCIPVDLPSDQYDDLNGWRSIELTFTPEGVF